MNPTNNPPDPNSGTPEQNSRVKSLKPDSRELGGDSTQANQNKPLKLREEPSHLTQRSVAPSSDAGAADAVQQANSAAPGGAVQTQPPQYAQGTRPPGSQPFAQAAYGQATSVPQGEPKRSLWGPLMIFIVLISLVGTGLGVFVFIYLRDAPSFSENNSDQSADNQENDASGDGAATKPKVLKGIQGVPQPITFKLPDQIRTKSSQSTQSDADQKPKANPAVIAWLKGFRADAYIDGQRSARLLMNSKVYSTGDILNKDPMIILERITSEYVYVKDENGLRYKIKR